VSEGVAGEGSTAEDARKAPRKQANDRVAKSGVQNEGVAVNHQLGELEELRLFKTCAEQRVQGAYAQFREARAAGSAGAVVRSALGDNPT
jgi:hypothetical protein